MATLRLFLRLARSLVKKEIKEGDLVLVHADFYKKGKLGFVYRKERRTFKHVVDPRVPELTRELEGDFFATWIFEWSKSSCVPAEELCLLGDE